MTMIHVSPSHFPSYQPILGRMEDAGNDDIRELQLTHPTVRKKGKISHVDSVPDLK